MSSCIKYIVICLTIIISLSRCKNSVNINYKQIKPTQEQNSLSDQNQQKITDNQDQLNIYKVKENVIDEITTQQQNNIQTNPVDIVDNLLKSSSKKLKIAIVAPMTGKYVGIGKMITESAMLTLHKSRFEQTATINIYNIDNLKDANWKNNKELNRLTKDNNDIIIGSGKNFEDTTKKILSILPEDKLFISFINNYELAKNYPNLIVAGFDDSYKVHSLFQYLKDYKKQFLSLILPSTHKGYLMEKLFRKLAPLYEVFIVNSQFYQSKNKQSIQAAVRGINRNLSTTYLVDEDGNYITETYKQNKERKKKQQLDNDQQEETKQTTQTVYVNAIYIDAEENDLITTMSYLDRFSVLNRNIQFFSNAVFDINSSVALKFENLLYVGYNYSIIDLFNKNFQLYFGNYPNYFSYLTYDTLSMLFYVANFGEMLPRFLFSEDGFRGLLDEFRFARDGNVERKMGIYSFKNSSMNRLFAPQEYLSLNNNNDVYFNKNL